LDVKRPYYQIRPYVPIVDEDGKINRKRKPIFLGFVDEMSMRQAKEEKERQMALINNSKYVIQSQIPFQLVLDKYIKVRLPQIPATRDSYETKIEKHIRPAFEWTAAATKQRLTRMGEITKADVEAWLNAKADQGYSRNTLLDLRKVLSAVFTQAKEWKLWDGENPCWHLSAKIGGVREVFRKTLPKEDGLAKFLAAIKSTRIISAEGGRLLVLSALASGGRTCEVLGMQVRDIDATKGALHIERDWTRGRIGPTKTEESQRVRQIPGLAEMLLDFAKGKGPEEFVFGRADQDGLPPDDRDLQQHVFRPAAKEAGIYVPGFGLRRFRHISLTWRQQEGAHPLEAMKQAGHKKLSTTWIYTQTEEDRERVHVQGMLRRVNVTQ
jgi:integrase